MQTSSFPGSLSTLYIVRDFFRFWIIDGPIGMIHSFGVWNTGLLHMFSVPLFLRTFVKPWKNEYREGLVGFARVMGVSMKSMVILIALVCLGISVVVELIILLLFILWPFLIIGLLFI
jgi:hypothetical protein